MRLVLAAMLAAASFAAAASPTAVTPPGAPYPRVQSGDCAALTAKLGPGNVWHTWFQGERRISDLVWTNYFDDPCFASLESCKAWLYWAETDWPELRESRPCHEGG